MRVRSPSTPSPSEACSGAVFMSISGISAVWPPREIFRLGSRYRSLILMPPMPACLTLSLVPLASTNGLLRSKKPSPRVPYDAFPESISIRSGVSWISHLQSKFLVSAKQMLGLA